MASERPSSPLPFLDSLAQSRRPEDQSLWLRIAADYLVEAGAAAWAEGETFSRTFSSCLQSVEESARFAIAKKLVARAETPMSILIALAGLDDEAGVLTLARARGLPRELLRLAAKDKVKARAIARRDDLDDDLAAEILAGDDMEALAALAANPRARLAGPEFLALARRARDAIERTGDRRLADRLLAGSPMRAEFASLFLEATSGQRSAILLAAQRAELGQSAVVAGVAAPRAAILRLERHALAGETELFVMTLAEILGCNPAMAQRLAADRSGEPLAVALAAMGAPNDVSVRILTSSDLHDRHDYRRVGALARLQDALSPSAARRVISAIVGGARLGDPEDPLVQRREATSRMVSPSATERRARPALPGPQREEAETTAILRRRRAFAVLAAGRKSRDH